MGAKRDNSSVGGELAEHSHSNKRRRDEVPAKSKGVESRSDATYGQRSVFSSLDQPTRPSDDDLEFEDESDALAYLRSVRQEADGIPHLLVAPKVGPHLPEHLSSNGGDAIDRSIYDDGVGDTRGFYYDGAYVAAPDSESSDEGEYDQAEWDSERELFEAEKALQESYYADLSSQFHVLRANLHRDPPPELVAALDKDHGVEVGRFGAKSWTFRVWNHRLRNTDPLPVQIAAMDRRDALKLLRIILAGGYMRHGREIRERTSRWVWALLARLPDRGELDNNEIFWIRELAKRAVLMMSEPEHAKAIIAAGLDGGGELDSDGEVVVAETGVIDRDDDAVSVQSLDLDRNEPEIEPVPQADHALRLPLADTEDGEMDMDFDDGEVTDTSSPARDTQADIAAAKARLLARLVEDSGIQDDASVSVAPDGEDVVADNNPTEKAGLDNARTECNMRATLNMILTVAGEFYGQKDLLQERKLFF